MDAEALETLITDTLPRLSRVGALVRFDLGKDGEYVVDARAGLARLSDESDCDCTIKIAADNLVKLIEGRMDPMLGYAMGKIRVVGALDVAMRLVRAIG
jgi:putative sterol carrier protein